MANNFSLDNNCKALWRFESGALTTDSKGTNTLTDNNTVGTDTVNFREGAASADLELDNAEYFSIADADLNTGFPLKSGDATKTISVCTWIKLESLPAVDTPIYLKHDSNNDKRSFNLMVRNDGKTYLALGYNSGVDTEYVNHATVLSTATWYHITASYQDSDKAYAIRIRDTNGAVVGSDLTGTATLDANKLNVEDSPVWIGYWYDSPDYFYFDGLIDEMVVFNDIITVDEATMIAKGLYNMKSGGGPADDRFRFRFSRLEGYTSTRLRRHNAQWHPSTGILNPALDAQEDNNSRMF